MYSLVGLTMHATRSNRKKAESTNLKGTTVTSGNSNEIGPANYPSRMTCPRKSTFTVPQARVTRRCNNRTISLGEFSRIAETLDRGGVDKMPKSDFVFLRYLIGECPSVFRNSRRDSDGERSRHARHDGEIARSTSFLSCVFWWETVSKIHIAYRAWWFIFDLPKSLRR